MLIGKADLCHRITVCFARTRGFLVTFSEIRFEEFVVFNFCLGGNCRQTVHACRLVVVVLLSLPYIATVNVSFAGLSCDLMTGI